MQSADNKKCSLGYPCLKAQTKPTLGDKLHRDVGGAGVRADKCQTAGSGPDAESGLEQGVDGAARHVFGVPANAGTRQNLDCMTVRAESRHKLSWQLCGIQSFGSISVVHHSSQLSSPGSQVRWSRSVISRPLAHQKSNDLLLSQQKESLLTCT